MEYRKLDNNFKAYNAMAAFIENAGRLRKEADRELLFDLIHAEKTRFMNKYNITPNRVIIGVAFRRLIHPEDEVREGPDSGVRRKLMDMELLEDIFDVHRIEVGYVEESFAVAEIKEGRLIREENKDNL